MLIPYGTLKLLDLAIISVSSGKSAVDDFAMDSLRALRYLRIQRGWIYTTKYLSPLVMCGKEKRALADVCVIDEQEVKGNQDPHALL